MSAAAGSLERAYRDERAAVLATITRRLDGDLALAEDVVQDAFVAAAVDWDRRGAPGPSRRVADDDGVAQGARSPAPRGRRRCRADLAMSFELEYDERPRWTTTSSGCSSPAATRR